MLIVAGHLLVSADKREEYLTVANEATRLARNAPGCLAFVQAADPLEADRIVIYECWESEHELIAFRSSDPEAASSPMPDIMGAEVLRYEISAVGPP